MATTRATFGSVLSVVTSSAGAIVSLLDNVNTGLSMLSTEISDAKVTQQYSSQRVQALAKKEQGLLFVQQSNALNADLLKEQNKSPEHIQWTADALTQWAELTSAK